MPMRLSCRRRPWRPCRPPRLGFRRAAAACAARGVPRPSSARARRARAFSRGSLQPHGWPRLRRARPAAFFGGCGRASRASWQESGVSCWQALWLGFVSCHGREGRRSAFDPLCEYSAEATQGAPEKSAQFYWTRAETAKSDCQWRRATVRGLRGKSFEIQASSAASRASVPRLLPSLQRFEALCRPPVPASFDQGGPSSPAAAAGR